MSHDDNRLMIIAFVYLTLCAMGIRCTTPKSAPQPAPAVVHCQHCAEMEHAGEESGR